MDAAAILLLGGCAWGAPTPADLEAAGAEKLFPILVFEMQLPPSSTNAWSLSKDAFQTVSRVRARPGLSSSDAGAVGRLAAAYDEHLAPSLRNLRHVVSFTRTDLQLLGLAVPSIDVNARHGRPSVARDPNRPEVDYNGAPQPVGFDAMDELREAALGRAAAARGSLEEGLLALRGAQAGGLSPAVREAALKMSAAFERALSVASQYEAFNAPGGPLGEEIRACKEYLEAANKALAPVPGARGRVVLAHNRAATAWAAAQFELGRNSAQARFLHGELDSLGPLRRP